MIETMKIETKWISKKTGLEVHAFYEETDDLSVLPQEKIKSVCAFCCVNKQFVVVKNHSN